jgi:hypothetical protein
MKAGRRVWASGEVWCVRVESMCVDAAVCLKRLGRRTEAIVGGRGGLMGGGGWEK